MTNSPLIGFEYLEDPQDHAEIKVNEALNLFELVVQCSVKNMNLSAPPGSPTAGDRHIVGTSPTGAWAGKTKNLAMYNGGWIFVAPQTGFEAFNQDDGLRYRYGAGVWAEIPFAAPVKTDATRGSGTVAGQQIFNSDDGMLNIWDGAAWTLPDGTVT